MSTWNKYVNFKQSSWIGKEHGFEKNTRTLKSMRIWNKYANFKNRWIWKKYLDSIKLHEVEKIHWFEKITQIKKIMDLKKYTNFKIVHRFEKGMFIFEKIARPWKTMWIWKEYVNFKKFTDMKKLREF